MYILGINCAYHESSVALVQVKEEEWRLLSFVEEERFNRKKRAKPALADNADVLPLKSLEWTLARAGISMEDVAHAATSMSPEKRKALNTQHHHPYDIEKNDFGTAEGEALFYNSVLNIENKLRCLGFNGQFHFLNHHDCHSASSYYVSGFSDAASLVVDGIGEFESISIYDCTGKEQQLVHRVDYPHSIGFLWEKMSEFIGFTRYDSGKVMGMSAFGGRWILEERFHKIAKLTEDGFELNDEVLQFRSSSHKALEEALGISRSNQVITDLNYNTLIYFDLAATLQDFTEKALLKLAEKARQLTGRSKLCISGGVALNCVANQKILESGLYEQVFIQPAANDAGTALGAALLIAHQAISSFTPHCKALSPYTQVAFGEEDYQEALAANPAIDFIRSDNVYADTARIIADGGIIAWFQGGMEYGPRALGHRSIIADARDAYTLKKINENVKLREIFRPLAPVILKEKAQEWFELEDKWIDQQNSPYLYMLATAQVKLDKRGLIPSVVHYDDTARVQIVDKDLSPGFHQLLTEFEKLTGVPILTNTSFNIQEPIVCSPQDALSTFLRSNMAALVMGDYIIQRKEVQIPKASDALSRAGNGSFLKSHASPMQTLFFVEQREFNKEEFAITKSIPVADKKELLGLIQAYRSDNSFCLPVVTDAFEYQGQDQVIPLQPEQVFFMDYLNSKDVNGSRFLEIGLGSGVLSIFCLLQGAKQGIGLDINPRAKVFTGFNALMNGVENSLEIRDGNIEDVFAPVAGEQFDLIISNPPFEPTPPGMAYYFNSAAGIYGLNFVRTFLREVDKYLKEDGVFQMVTMAPGTEQEPFMLYDLANKYLPGCAVEVILDGQPIAYGDFVDRFVHIFKQDTSSISFMKQRAKDDGVTHLHMLIFKYRKGVKGQLVASRTGKTYETWSSPLGTAVSVMDVVSGV
ncbi:MAG: 50S ribosomal protein L11 methyltransferase [Phaeodactylibacter sp.]|nr:50S ribosomal protein L11 methyltransferase [Phaeodactylibacter sp.]